MSKEVKRYELRIVDRYAGDGTGDIETDARMKQEARGRYVLFSDYDALLAERDAYKAELAELVRIVSMSCDGSSARNKAMAKAHAALQGAQP
ncbi:hypothetical protein DN824_21970 [Stutzerimonas nosocomialis]|uniref:hypothetical protein n=1 Tax=Stutzerimonas nosocomialis TaxID=1056496 RepID=UPI001108A516|nr:hypothetical protein [Stutzerimonas nosocomialis]TLX52778.1 hypothetical protein DN824_21970 [Stutzerimonas nosocomialis]